jgi:endonuclease/exonuclease/phosphatase (EEP) superfamily protein YafD
VRWALWGLVLSLVGYAGLAATGRWTVLGELASQFRFLFGFAALASAGLFAVARHRRKAGVAILLALWGSWPEGSLFLGPGAPSIAAKAALVAAPSGDQRPASSPDSARPPFHMISCNVLRPNARYDEVFNVLLKSEPDVIGLLECSEEWRDAALRRLLPKYPYYAVASNTPDWSEHTWALMLFSKTELTSTEVLRLDFKDWELRPVLQVTLAEPLDLTITLAHPERPGRPARMRARRTALERIAASDVQGNWLVIGDLNSTSTSPLFGDLIERTGLRDSRAGFGRLPSWGFGNRLPGPIPIPLPPRPRISVAIDHALVGQGLEVLDRQTLYVPGSDHRAVSVTLR